MSLEDFNDDYNRLAGLMIEQDPSLAEQGKHGHTLAVERLKGLTLELIVGDKINSSISLQAALLTSLNTGKRCFLGGVFVQIPKDVPCLLPFKGSKTLNEVVVLLGGKFSDNPDRSRFRLFFGRKAVDDNSLQVICNGWQGGVCPYSEDVELDVNPDFSLGGILAGALGISLMFQKATNLNKFSCEEAVGISLWRPDLDWLNESAKGPHVRYLPKRVWLLGLGHLGQAYTWTLSLLPYSSPTDVLFQFQDFDEVVRGNFEAGMLCEEDKIGCKKARVCAEWLEAFGFQTNIVERKYTENTVRGTDEPSILLAGLDSLNTRKILRIKDFNSVLDCGLGGSVSSFDSITFHNFPVYGKEPAEAWNGANLELKLKSVQRMVEKEFSCGLVKGISTAFVGAVSSAIAVSEILRGYNGGVKVSFGSFSLRNIKENRFVTKDLYQIEMLDGYVDTISNENKIAAAL